MSRFLRDYVYIPLGGNRKTVPRRYENLMLTMLVGGLWHGAGWTFVFWGALHGIYLVINHFWRSFRRRIDIVAPPGTRALATWITFVAVVVAWVFFRATDFTTAVSIVSGMAGRNGVVLPQQWQSATGGSAWLANHGVQFGKTVYFDRVAQLNWLCFLLVFCWVAPNTQQLLAAYRPALMTSGYGELGNAGYLAWRPNWLWVVALALLGSTALLSVHRYSEFIYFRF